MSSQQSESRREFVKKATYIAPTILTLVAAPAFAKSASVKDTTYGGGAYVPPIFSNGQTKTVYDWLISDPARAARLADAAKKLKANKDAIVQLTLQVQKEIVTGLSAKQGLTLEVLKQAITNANLGELAKALLAAS